MQAIEAKQQVGAQEGAHFFYTISFLAATSLIEFKYSAQACDGVNLGLLVDFVFYGLLVWATYLLVTILPNCKNVGIQNFFRFMHGIFAVYLLAVFIYANLLFFDDKYTESNCVKTAPVLAYFTSLFIAVGYLILIIFVMSLISAIFRRFSKNNTYDDQALEEL